MSARRCVPVGARARHSRLLDDDSRVGGGTLNITTCPVPLHTEQTVNVGTPTQTTRRLVTSPGGYGQLDRVLLAYSPFGTPTVVKLRADADTGRQMT